MQNTPLILLFVKEPVPGRVKSRLAASLGADTALGLYRNFVLDTLASSETCGIPFRICFHPPDAGPAMRQWLGGHYVYQPQEGADVGERMENAFKRVFAEGCPCAILVGSDIPDLSPAAFTGALRALDGHDAVIGPARDGGYYLIGFRKDAFLPDIFRNIEWGTASVFLKTMRLFSEAGRRVQQLPLWRDVDTLDDLRDLAARNRTTAFSRSHTMQYVNDTMIEHLSPEAPDAVL